MEFGCGTGESCIFLAQLGFRVTGVDLLPKPVTAAKLRAEAGGVAKNCTFIEADVFDLGQCVKFCQALQGLNGSRGGELAFDMIYDCQTYHALRNMHSGQYVKLLHRYLKVGGLLFLLTGNAREPTSGPTPLTQQEILSDFPSNQYKVIVFEETRFDPTPHYLTMPACPLAWCVVLQKLN